MRMKCDSCQRSHNKLNELQGRYYCDDCLAFIAKMDTPEYHKHERYARARIKAANTPREEQK